MIYNNLLLFLVAIFIFSIDTVPEAPLLPLPLSPLLLLISLVGYERLCHLLFRRSSAFQSAGYFRTERQLSIMALVFFGVGALYLADAKYYLYVLSVGDRLPALVNVAGLLLFLVYLSLMWQAARRPYEQVFGRHYTRWGFIFANVKVNLPIVLPWVVLSLCYDLLSLLPSPGLQGVLASGYGDLLFFGLFLVFVALFFPPLVRNLWGCRPMPPSQLRDRLLTFCNSQGFHARLYLWPLFEGRVLTAGVMGIVPGLRYILLTPAIIETLDDEELESVLAHEIGHVKKKHLLLYIFLLGGFSIFAGLLAQPFVFYVLSKKTVVDFMLSDTLRPESVMAIVSGVPLLVFMIIYFRFVFGYFIRNFERQADLHVLTAVGHGRSLISAFEKIAVMSGNIRDQKNWHHFGIGERIDCIAGAEREPVRIQRHDRKVRASLLTYVLVLIAAFTLVRQIPTEDLARTYEERYAEAVLLQKAGQEPENALWHRMMGDLMMTRKLEGRAYAAYEKAFSLEPSNPEIMNNFAWLLLTSEDRSLRDPYKALTLARAAAALEVKGYILDTLATAYWANGFVERAVEVARQAEYVDPAHGSYYRAQAAKFSTEKYEEPLPSGSGSESQEKG